MKKINKYSNLSYDILYSKHVLYTRIKKECHNNKRKLPKFYKGLILNNKGYGENIKYFYFILQQYLHY